MAGGRRPFGRSAAGERARFAASPRFVLGRLSRDRINLNPCRPANQPTTPALFRRLRRLWTSLYSLSRADKLHVLLVERGQEPYRGHWALPGGFVRPDEDLDAAAARELEEEAGLTGDSSFLEQLASYGRPDRDPRMRVITVAYWAACRQIVPRSGGDASAADLLPVADIENRSLRLAFDHQRIVEDALERLRSKLEYTAVAAKFCPPEFTISELRRVYEAVWDEGLDPGNFQRIVRQNGTFYQAPPSRRADATRGGRPASLWSARSGSALPLLERAPRRPGRPGT